MLSPTHYHQVVQTLLKVEKLTNFSKIEKLIKNRKTNQKLKILQIQNSSLPTQAGSKIVHHCFKLYTIVFVRKIRLAESSTLGLYGNMWDGGRPQIAELG
jgi:hypothetical protein